MNDGVQQSGPGGVQTGRFQLGLSAANDLPGMPSSEGPGFSPGFMFGDRSWPKEAGKK